MLLWDFLSCSTLRPNTILINLQSLGLGRFEIIKLQIVHILYKKQSHLALDSRNKGKIKYFLQLLSTFFL